MGLVISLFSSMSFWLSSASGFDLWEATRLHDDPGEVLRTWLGAEIRVPGKLLGPDVATIFGPLGADYVQKRLEALPASLNIPIVIFLHGCAGISIAEHKFAQIVEAGGFATIHVNSFARSTRRRNCNYQTYASGMFPPAYLYRRAELLHAMGQAKHLAWADSERIVLGGFSEGAVAVALWGGEVDAAAYIITAWTCTAPPEFAWLNGLRVAATKPVFAVVAKRDPWFDWPGWRGDCATAAVDRVNVSSLVIEGAVHNVFAYPETAQALVAFLRLVGSN